MKMHSAENFMRSAKAPTISAGVMIAKVIWNIMYTVSGTVVTIGATSLIPDWRTNACVSLPLLIWSAIPFSMKRDRSPT